MEAHGDGPGGLKLYSNPHGSVRCYHEGCRCPDCENARVDYYGGMCSYCQSAPFEHIDHAIPVARGGSNWPSNLRPSCGDCNLRKWTKTAMEFLP